MLNLLCNTNPDCQFRITVKLTYTHLQNMVFLKNQQVTSEPFTAEVLSFLFHTKL